MLQSLNFKSSSHGPYTQSSILLFCLCTPSPPTSVKLEPERAPDSLSTSSVVDLVLFFDPVAGVLAKWSDASAGTMAAHELRLALRAVAVTMGVLSGITLHPFQRAKRLKAVERVFTQHLNSMKGELMGMKLRLDLSYRYDTDMVYAHHASVDTVRCISHAAFVTKYEASKILVTMLLQIPRNSQSL